MAQKLDTFKGKITSKSTPKEITKTLSSLQSYLEKYEEKEASAVIEQLKFNKSGTHQDKVLSKQFIKLYSKRTEMLESIAKSVSKMQRDMIDEQDTSIKKIGIRKKVGKVAKGAKSIANKIVEATKSAGNFISDLFSKLTDLKSLIPWIIGGITSTLTGLASKIALKILGGAKSILFWMIKIPLKIAKWIGGKIIKVLGKAFAKLGMWMGGLMRKAGAKVASWVSKMVGKMGSAMGKVWSNLKNIKVGKTVAKAVTTVKNAGSKVAGKVAGVAKAVTAKIPKPVVSGIGKIKDSIKMISEKVPKVLSKIKLPGAGKAAGLIGKTAVSMLGKIASGVGIAFLAYNAYTAYKKSNSAISFGINLLDEVSGGLIDALFGDKGGKSVGEYLESFINDKMEPPSSPEVKNAQASANSQNAGTGNSANSSGANNANSSTPEKITFSETKEVIRDSTVSRQYLKLVEEYGDKMSPEQFDEYHHILSQDPSKITEIERRIKTDSNLINAQTTNIQSIRNEELINIKNQAVQEASQIALNMNKTAVAGMAGTMMGAQVMNQTNISIGQMHNPYTIYQPRGNLRPGATQG